MKIPRDGATIFFFPKKSCSEMQKIVGKRKRSRNKRVERKKIHFSYAKRFIETSLQCVERGNCFSIDRRNDDDQSFLDELLRLKRQISELFSSRLSSKEEDDRKRNEPRILKRDLIARQLFMID